MPHIPYYPNRSKLRGIYIKIKWAGAKLVKLLDYIGEFIPKVKQMMDIFRSGKARVIQAMKDMKERVSTFFRNLGDKSDDVSKKADDALMGCANRLGDLSEDTIMDISDDTFIAIGKSNIKWTDDAVTKLDNLIANIDDDIASWSEDAIDGLGKLLKKNNVNSDDVAYRILTEYGDDVAEQTFRGINKGVIDDLYDVDAEDLAKYIDDFYLLYPGEDPLTHDEGIIKMFRNKNIYCEGEDIGGIIYLTNERLDHSRGRHLYATDGITKPKTSCWPTAEYDTTVRPDIDWDLDQGQIANDIPKVMSKEQVDDLVRECIDKPDYVIRQADGRYKYEYNPSKRHPEYGIDGMEVIVDPNGKVITSYPTSGSNVKSIGYNPDTEKWFYIEPLP